MSDLISREKTFDVLSDYYHHKTQVQHQALKEALDRVPSAEKTGRWIEDDRGYFRCSVCGEKPKDQTSKTDYCPKCGARMEVANE